MKKHIWISFMTIVTLLLGSVTGFAVYEQPITFSEVSYTTAEGAPIDAPQAGGFIATITATYSGSDARTTRLLCAFIDRASGAVKEIAVSNTATWPGEATQTLKTRMTLPTIVGCDFKYFFIDDLNRHTPLANQAPGAPGALSVDTVTKNSVNLSWEAADDDFQSVTGYEIYKNGAKVLSTNSTSLTLSNLMRNTPVNIAVKSNDGNHLSEAVSATVTPLTVSELRLNSANETAQQIASDYISFFSRTTSAGLVSDAGTVAGLPCYMVREGKYPSFSVNTDYFSEADNQAVLEITYLDQLSDGKTASTAMYVQVETTTATPGKHALSIAKVDDPKNPGTPISVASRPFTVKNSGVWKTEVRTLVNCAFSAAGVLDGGYNKHLRLYTTSGASDVYLAKASLVKPEDYTPMNPNMTVDGGMIVYGMDFTLPGGCGTAYLLTEQDGQACVASTAAGDLAYMLTDSTLSAAASAQLEVTFYDGQAGDTLMIGGQSIKTDGSGWRTVILDTTGAALASGFSITSQSGDTVYLKNLQAYAE